MGQRIIDTGAFWMDFHLNQLGLRVWEHSCQLISKHRDTWVTLGPAVALPVLTPRNHEELMAAWADPIKLTAYQIMQDNPGADLADLLMKKKSFRDVMESRNILPAGKQETVPA